MEALARDRKLDLQTLTADAWEALWCESKQALAKVQKS
jgi:hypothetical protein